MLAGRDQRECEPQGLVSRGTLTKVWHRTLHGCVTCRSSEVCGIRLGSFQFDHHPSSRLHIEKTCQVKRNLEHSTIPFHKHRSTTEQTVKRSGFPDNRLSKENKLLFDWKHRSRFARMITNSYRHPRNPHQSAP